MKISDIPCPYCKNVHVIRFGHLRNGYQRYRCRGCARTFCPDSIWSYEARRMRKQAILIAYSFTGNKRGTARLYQVSRNTLTNWIKQEEAMRRP